MKQLACSKMPALFDCDLTGIMEGRWKDLTKSKKDKFHSPTPGTLKGESKDHVDLAKYEP